MNGVNLLLGHEKINPLPLKTYDDEIINFLNDFSRELMKIKTWPEIVALGFFCRKGNLEKLRANYPEYKSRLGRGLCFHIAPSNIAVNFAFSYIFGLLSGCANVVRVPSKDFEQVSIILSVLEKILTAYPEIYERTQFIKYPSENNLITQEYSLMSDARLIWGGDETIKKIRSLETKPRCVDISFADRFSVCLIDADAVLKADEDELKRLVQNFYNDTFLIDQNACSSPSVIFWLNNNLNARKKFWSAVNSYALLKFRVQPAVSVNKLARACSDAIKFDIKTSRYEEQNLIYLAEINSLDENLNVYKFNSGYFYEYALKNLDELFNPEIINAKFQTLTYYGVNPENLRELVIKNNLPGFDRITPIGRALDINLIWDGFDIVRTLSRIVNKE